MLGESIGIAGAGISLNYRSSRTEGYTAARRMRIELTNDVLPPELAGVSLVVEVAGQRHDWTYAPSTDLSQDFESQHQQHCDRSNGTVILLDAPASG